MNCEIQREYNGLALILKVNDHVHDPETELLREFISQHEDSVLVLIYEGGHYSNIGAEISFSRWCIRKKVRRTFRERVTSVLRKIGVRS